MTLLQRFPLLLVQPDYATSDLYYDPPVVNAFYVVTAYAVISALNALVGIIVATGSISASVFTVIGTIALVYMTWVILSLVFHFVADLVGGLGELHNAISYVGLAAAPNVVVSFLSLLITVVRLIVAPEDPHDVFSAINLGFSLIGMAWGWPGVLCYFGIKNGEQLSSVKAILIVMPVFFLFAALEIYNSKLFDL